MRLDLTAVLRRRIYCCREDAVALRPNCLLACSVGCDEDGRVYVHFQCLNHGALWREYVAGPVRGRSTTMGDACATVSVGAIDPPAASCEDGLADEGGFSNDETTEVED